jgi:8-oxo-dGTP pyrophosphatase MutT (NUDIX family)/phosphohistidine phosphatase SixA
VSSVPIRAAGAVLWRREDAGVLQLAVVHRPRYDDWSLPKGKLDPGETIPGTAVREILEETGFAAKLGRYLVRVAYPVVARDGVGTADKTVDYFAAEAVGGAFETNDEVDELRWVEPAKAEILLTRRVDVDVVRTFCLLPAELTTVVLARHAKAGKREEWNGDDDLRPLSSAGQRQSDGLRALMPMFGADRVFSAPRLRCVQTVQGVADDLGLEIRHEPLLSEEGYWPDPVRGIGRLLTIVAEGGAPLISSQGGVIPDLVSALADRDGVELADSKHGVVPSKKGSFWVLSFADGPKLVAADYFAGTLPVPELAHH